MQIVGNVILAAGIIFISFGVVGLFKYKNFYERILVAAKIDTVGAITIIIGLILKHGFGYFSLKLVLLLGIMLIINPLASNIIARSAYLSGYEIENGVAKDFDDRRNL